MGKTVLGMVLATLGTLGALGCAGLPAPAALPPVPEPGYAVLHADGGAPLEPLREAFDARRGRVRVVMLVAPT